MHSEKWVFFSLHVFYFFIVKRKTYLEKLVVFHQNEHDVHHAGKGRMLESHIRIRYYII